MKNRKFSKRARPGRARKSRRRMSTRKSQIVKVSRGGIRL